MLVNRTSFNKVAISKMSYKDFEKAYRGKFNPNVDLKELFVENGGKIKAVETNKEK